MICGACPAPRPKRLGGYAPPNPAVHFWTPKSEPKNRQNQGFGFLCLNWSLSDLGHFCTELGFCYLIYSGSINDTSASGPVKEIAVSLVAYRNIFLEAHPREYPKEFRTAIGSAGDSKGGEPPLCRRGGGVHRGGTPSKGSRPYAPFCLLFRRGKSRPGPGGGAPKNSGSGPGRPGRYRIEWNLFGRKIFLPLPPGDGRI